MASTAAGGAAQAPTPSEYIVHHLGHLSTGYQKTVVDFSIINLDTIFWSVMMGVVACFLMYKAASRATSGVPGRFQAWKAYFLTTEWFPQPTSTAPSACRSACLP